MSDFKGPVRWPWLLVVVLLIAIAVVGAKLGMGRREVEASEPVRSVRSPEAPAVVSADVAGAATVTQAGQESLQPPANLVESLLLGENLEKAGRFLEARDIYYGLYGSLLRSSERAQVESRLGRINVLLVTTQRRMPEKLEYIVKTGDSLDRIAKQNNTTVELLQASNNISRPDRIRAGDVLRVFTGGIVVEISKSRNDMILRIGDRFFKRYQVGTGKFGKTPVGTFQITERIPEPTWWRPDGKAVKYGDPENILGTRWMTLRAIGETPDVRGYGIHGTWEPESIGKAESAGCIRMRNPEVEELFLLLPVGTKVTIVE